MADQNSTSKKTKSSAREKLEREQKIKETLIQKGSESGAHEKVEKKFWHYFKKNKSSLPVGQQVEKIYDLLSSKKLTTQDKALILGALLYFINPFDLLPDITPFLGFFDDMSVIAMVYRYLGNRSLEDKNPPTSKDSDSE